MMPKFPNSDSIFPAMPKAARRPDPRKGGVLMLRKGRNPIKSCPFRDQPCLKQGCAIYNEQLDRCEIGLLAYNMYLLATALQQSQLEPEAE
jgi:hypothetical protein